MKAVARILWLHLVYQFRRWEHAHAREFRHGLEQTIARERVRAQNAVEDAEIVERRAYAAIVAARADRRIPVDAVTETR